MFCALFHGFGSISVLIPALAYKAGIVFQKTFHPAKVAEAVIKENITHMLGVPTHYRQLLRYELSLTIWASLKRLFARQRPLAVKWHGSGTKKPEYIWMRATE